MNYKNKRIFILFIVIIISLFISACTSNNSDSYVHTNQILNENNQNLIGQEIVDSASTVNETLNEGLNTSDIVHQIDIEGLCPNSFVEIEINDSDYNNVPGQLMINNSVSILTKSNHKGWLLKSGDVLEYSFEKYESDVVSNQTLIVGYIYDGIMKEGTAIDTLTGTYTLEAKENGTYYIYLMSASSDYLALKESTLYYYPN